MTPGELAGVCAGLAVVGGGLGSRRSGRLTRVSAVSSRGPRWSARWLGGATCGGAVVSGVVAGWVVAGVVAAAGLAGTRAWRSRARQRDRQARRDAVAQFTAALAAELRTGVPPPVALRGAAQSAGRLRLELTEVATAAARGGDTAAALAELARAPGGEGLAAVAACWQVSIGSGSGLADALDTVADALDHDQRLEELVHSQLAGPRASARALALLPAVGLAMGAGLGTHPLRFLTHTRPGALCLLGAAALEALGLAWTERIARGALG